MIEHQNIIFQKQKQQITMRRLVVKMFNKNKIKNDKVTYENIRKIANGEGDDYTTDCL